MKIELNDKELNGVGDGVFCTGEEVSSCQIATRVNVLGVGVSPLNMDRVVEFLVNSRVLGESGYVCVTGVHGVIESQRDSELKQIHNRSLLTVPDGMPTVWMGREQGFVHMGRVYGPDLMLRVMAETSGSGGIRKYDLGVKERETDLKLNNKRHETEEGASRILTHFLYGATEEMLEMLSENLEARFPGVQIVGTYAPPFRPLNMSEEEELRQIVSECKPDFFWVGLSTPKQERFMYAHSADMSAEDRGQKSEGSSQWSGADLRPLVSDLCKFPLDCGIMLGVGAAFPIHAGLQKDAPEWIKNSGLQWFYRLCQDPQRLWRRYLDIVPRFLFLSAMQLLGIKKYSLEG